VSFENAGETFLNNVGSDVEILQLRVAPTLVDDQSVLLDQIRFFFFLGLSSSEFLLNVLNQPKSGLQIRTRSADLARFADVGASISPAKQRK
jgi:hypothetical protein